MRPKRADGAAARGTAPTDPPPSPRTRKAAGPTAPAGGPPRTELPVSRVAPPYGAFVLGRPSIAKVVVRRGELPEHLFRRLLGAYLGGAREFVIREAPRVTPATREVVHTFCRRTRQPEIVWDDDGQMRLKDLAYESPVPIAQRLGRMGRIVVQFHRDAVESWGQLPLADDGQWERRDDEIDREAWYVQRLAAHRFGPDEAGASMLGVWTIARSLERIADHAIVLGETGGRLIELPRGSAPITSLRQFHEQAMAHLEGALSAPDDASANDLLDLGEALIASGRSLSDRLLPAVGGGAVPPATAAAVARILESIGRTVAYSQDIAEVALDRAIPVAFSDPLLAAESASPARAR
ncbi:MAG TPA: PhoU domain-containing protein [Thermoplasmata archaeon]|nr:PhoU domain-containing protein [Thermoplasmata archaeon]